jgi:porin
MLRAVTLVAMVGALLFGVGAHAETPPAPTAPDPTAPAPKAPSEPWLLGNWGGARTRLYEMGVDLQLGFVGEFAFNPVGGTQTLGSFTGQAQFGATFDLEKLISVPKTKLQVTYTSRFGRNLAEDAGLDTLELVQEVWGRGQTVRLTQAFLEHQFFDDLLMVRWGRVAMGDAFAAFSCDFQNLTFCGSQPGNIVGSYIYNWPISQWGAVLKLKIPDFGYVQAGIYDVNGQYLGYANKLWPVWYPNSDGALIPVEIAWLPKFGGGRLPGSYKIGGWYSTAALSDVVNDFNGNPAVASGMAAVQRRGLYGGYLNFEQQFTRNASENPKGGLRGFVNFSVADQETSTTWMQIAGGLIYTGPFSERPNDQISFAAGTTQVNPRLVGLQNTLNGLGLEPALVKYSEYVFELQYAFVPVPGFTLRPNVQYVYTPGTISSNVNILVLGLKTVINF